MPRSLLVAALVALAAPAHAAGGTVQEAQVHLASRDYEAAAAILEPITADTPDHAQVGRRLRPRR